MYLAALLVAEEPGSTETDPQKRVGRAIHTLLTSMDNPLAGKTSQAIDSAPNVPDWLRNPASKTSSNIPPRWVIHEMFDQYAPKDVKQTTTRLGKVRAGAVGITVELDKDTASMAAHGYTDATPKTVFKMVRKGAFEKVALNAPRAQQMIDVSVAEYPELKPAKPIIEHAINASRVETDFRNAPLQSAIAHQMADGMRITVDGETFTLHEVSLLKANEVSHEMRWAPGKVFNELPKTQKAKSAAALFTAENYLALSGHQIDWDRHGAQAMVDGHDIYLLDRGGMALTAPSADDKKYLGTAIATALNEHVAKGTPFNDAFSHAVEAAADGQGKINYYLATVARGQHNLGDLRREMTPEQQMKSLITVFATGQVGAEILQSAMERLSPEAKGWIQQQAMKEMFGGARSVKIDDPNIAKRQTLADVSTLPSVAIVPRPDSSEEAIPEWLAKLLQRKNGGPPSSDALLPRPKPPLVKKALAEFAEKKPRDMEGSAAIH